MIFNMKIIIKCLAVSLSAIFISTVSAASKENRINWIDFSDPTAIYTSAGMSGGNEGVDIYATFGSYLGGQFKQKLTIEAKHDLEYYNVNYLALNTVTNTGFLVDTSWSRDILGVKDVNDSAVGIIKKLPLMNNHLNIYPSMKLGFLWGDEIKSTTYVEVDAAVRYSFDRALWVGITPSYRYAMQGIEIRDWKTSIDVGFQFANGFAVAAHVNDDDEFWGDMTFAF